MEALSIRMVKKGCNWLQYSNYHDFVGLRMKLNPSQAVMSRMVDLSDKRCPD